jgi:hypothetical protein
LTECLRDKNSWVICKTRVLDEYFPHFVSERLIRNLIVFNFHEIGQSVRSYIDQVFQAAEFLEHEAIEQQLVERIIRNFHPDILKQAVFLDKPRSRKELTRINSLIEEKFSISAERQRSVHVENRGNVSRGPSCNLQRETCTPAVRVVKCWQCGRTGHVQRRCPERKVVPAKAQVLSSFYKVVAGTADVPLWVMVQLKSGRIPALLDTGAQFSCIRSDVAEFLYLTGEPCVFGACSVGYVLADGTRCQLNNVMKLHVKLLGFSWNHEFRVLNGGSFPFILGLDFMRRTQMTVDVAAKRFQFGFAPHLRGECSNRSKGDGGDQYPQGFVSQVSEIGSNQIGAGDRLGSETFANEFPGLFSSVLGTANCAPYEIELLDSNPVRSLRIAVPHPKLRFSKAWLMNFWSKA